MDPLTSYKLMSKRVYNFSDDTLYIPPKLFDFFNTLGKTKKINKDRKKLYKNFDDFIEGCISFFI